MRYNPKYITEFVIQSNYGQGWEDETAEETAGAAIRQLRAYQQNSPYPCRLIRRKVKNPDYLPNAITKAAAVQQFKDEFYPYLDKTDRTAVRTEWNDFVDMLQKSRHITQQQAQNWCQPAFVARSGEGMGFCHLKNFKQ